MSILDKVRRWALGPESASPPAPKADSTDPAALAEALREVLDPELGLDIVSMGLVREITVAEGVAKVRMTLTTAGCPVGPWILDDVRRVLEEQGVKAEIEVEHEPPWSPEDMEPEARRRLRGA